GIFAQVKQRLIERFNLHTIVRLPIGVFAPYTPILTNILFFDAADAGGVEPCTREIWSYELPLPEGRRSYSKTKPLQFDDFAECIAWWGNRVQNQRAWCVPVKQIIDNSYDLDVKNPQAGGEYEHIPPEQLVKEIIAKQRRI